MSRTLSTNSGSLESLNVSERCGWRPKAVQIRRMVVCEKPVAAAIERIDQWVASPGVERSVLSITAPAIVGDCAGSAWSNLVQQGLHAPSQEPPSPLPNGMLMHTQFHRDSLARDAVRAPQNDPAPLRHGSRDTPSAHLPLGVLPLT